MIGRGIDIKCFRGGGSGQVRPELVMEGGEDERNGEGLGRTILGCTHECCARCCQCYPRSSSHCVRNAEKNWQ
jgi:hypothetical protein